MKIENILKQIELIEAQLAALKSQVKALEVETSATAVVAEAAPAPVAVTPAVPAQEVTVFEPLEFFAPSKSQIDAVGKVAREIRDRLAKTGVSPSASYLSKSFSEAQLNKMVVMLRKGLPIIIK